jgi:hypothetical protein
MRIRHILELLDEERLDPALRWRPASSGLPEMEPAHA